MTYSIVIDSVVQTAISDGNKVLDISTGWTKVREVVRMQNSRSDNVKEMFDNDVRLRFWTVEPTPHNRGEEGYTDDTNKVSISFPR